MATNDLFITNKKLLEPSIKFYLQLTAVTSLALSPLHYLLTLPEGERAPLLLQFRNILISEIDS
jgi:hypothetical protein